MKKLSRILSGKQTPDIEEAEVISKALGFNPEIFLEEKFNLADVVDVSGTEYVCYAGKVMGEQQEFVGKLIDLIENADEVLGAYDRFKCAIME